MERLHTSKPGKSITRLFLLLSQFICNNNISITNKDNTHFQFEIICSFYHTGSCSTPKIIWDERALSFIIKLFQLFQLNDLYTPNSKKVVFWTVALCIAQCCMPRPQSIVVHIASKANTRISLSHRRHLCFLKIRYSLGLIPWCVAVLVCNNAQCTMQQFRRQPFLN